MLGRESERKAHWDALLDKALEDTFPASDPVSLGIESAAPHSYGTNDRKLSGLNSTKRTIKTLRLP